MKKHKCSHIAYKPKEGRENVRDTETRGRPQTHRSDANVATNAIVPAPTKPVSHNTEQVAGSCADKKPWTLVQQFIQKRPGKYNAAKPFMLPPYPTPKKKLSLNRNIPLSPDLAVSKIKVRLQGIIFQDIEGTENCDVGSACYS
jgi:hypothetical protein